jgi:peptide/nickel transport system substrate-binding protein
MAAVFMMTAIVIPDLAHAQRKILNIGHKEPEIMDPYTTILGFNQSIVRLVYRGLVRFKITPDNKVTTAEVEPDMAESWAMNDDGTVWTFKLRKGVKWHKGFGDFTAEDVKFSIERVQDRNLQGNKFAKNLEIIKEVKVLDDYTMLMTLTNFDPVFLLHLVGYQQGYIVSKKAVTQYGDDYAWNPVGTGPFYFDRHMPREKVVLKAHRDYYFGRLPIDEVHWFDVPEDSTKMIGLEKGTFDIVYPNIMTTEIVAQVEKLGMVIDLRGPGGQQRFHINYTKPPFDDIRVRKAFMHSIDRQAIVETLHPKGLAKVGSAHCLRATSVTSRWRCRSITRRCRGNSCRRLATPTASPSRTTTSANPTSTRRSWSWCRNSSGKPGSTSSCNWSSIRPITNTSARISTPLCCMVVPV